MKNARQTQWSLKAQTKKQQNLTLTEVSRTHHQRDLLSRKSWAPFSLDIDKPLFSWSGLLGIWILPNHKTSIATKEKWKIESTKEEGRMYLASTYSKLQKQSTSAEISQSKNHQGKSTVALRQDSLPGYGKCRTSGRRKANSKEKMTWEVCVLGINFLFIGANSLENPNNMEPKNAPLKVTRCLATISITASLHKCPSQTPRAMQSLKGFENFFSPPFLSRWNDQVKRGHCKGSPLWPHGKLPWLHVASSYFCPDKHNQV